MTQKWRQQIAVVRGLSVNQSGVTTSREREVLQTAQAIDSENHAVSLLGRTSRDIGGPFSSWKIEAGPVPKFLELEGTPVGPVGNRTPRSKSKGNLYPTVDAASAAANVGYTTRSKIIAGAPVAVSESSLSQFGTAAIAASAPTNPVFEGATAVAELFSGIPAVPGRGGNVGGEYLNYQFGISPTLADTGNLRNAAKNSEKIIAQLERDSGRTTRRKIQLPSVSTTVSQDLGPKSPTYIWGPPGTTEFEIIGTAALVTTTTETVSFSGAFTYHLPPKGTWRRKIAELDAVYGVRPGIDTAWNLVPFSWMADWYGNMGTVLQNLNTFAADGLVMQYGYVTRRLTITNTWSNSCRVRYYMDQSILKDHHCSFSLTRSVQQRFPAHPYGFGVRDADLSARQVAILAALGISSRR
nr:MAG: hypothetical protein 1 [Leviviridae sp.]